MGIARRWVVPAGLVVVLGAYCVTRALWIPDRAHPWTNTLVGLATLALGVGLGLDRAELGLELRDAGRGLWYGAAVWIAVAVPLVVLALVPATRDALQDDTTIVSTGAMLRRTLVVIPLGTALLEEAVFRGVLLAVLARRATLWRAAWISSVLFGLWHVPPTLHSAEGSGAIGDASRSGGSTALVVLGIVLVMTAAGVALCWLRIRSRSLVAPFVAHWWINATAFAVAWSVSR